MHVSIAKQKKSQNSGTCIITRSGIECRRQLIPLAGCIFFLLLLLPVPAFAQGPVDLTFGETGVFPWRASGIMPGDHGSTFIDLHNNGTEKGIVYLWVDNISMSDRSGNPGGGLVNYLYFNVSNKNINSTVILPAPIHSFPTAPLMPDHFIIISSLNAGETARLNWTWEFKETGRPQNDAQNNTLQFNLSYTLVNLSAPMVPTPAPTGVPADISDGGVVIPQGPSIFDALIIPGLNPVQRLETQRTSGAAFRDHDLARSS